jgi:phosphopentomutase
VRPEVDVLEPLGAEDQGAEDPEAREDARDREDRPAEGRRVSARRAFVVVLDACGAGELPDAAAYGDAGADTLVHVARAVGGLRLPALASLGLGLVRPIDGLDPDPPAPALHGRLHPLGPGKASTTGHWELMGVVAPAPLPV